MMTPYRCWYILARPELGLGSAAAVDMYSSAGAWPSGLPHVPDEPASLFTVDRLAETHVLVRTMEARSPDHVFHLMQADRWSDADREAFEEQFQPLGLTHSSMCPGDVVEDVTSGTYYECDMMGWRILDATDSGST